MGRAPPGLSRPGIQRGLRFELLHGIGSVQMTLDLDGLAVFPDDHETPLAESPSQRGLSALGRISVC